MVPLERETVKNIDLVKTIRDDLCHNQTEAMDEEAFEDKCEQLRRASIDIFKPTAGKNRICKMCYVTAEFCRNYPEEEGG